MGVAEQVEKKPACISPLIIIPNQGKLGFRICHELRMLNAVTVKDWGPAMDKTARLQGILRGEFFGVFDLAKGFMQLPINRRDRRYFGFYIGGSFFVFKRLPFGL